jgi:enoyl-CoA hydratase
MARERIRIERRRGVATLTLDHPPVNVIDLAMIREALAALRVLQQDSSIRALVVQGSGRCFSGGVDIREHLPELIPETLGRFHDLVSELYHFPVPTLARVHGAAIGGGLELVLACDLAVAVETSTFGVPEITLGCFAPVAVVVLRRLVGDRRANEMLLTGRTVTAPDALAMGLVNEVVSPKRIDDETRRILGRILPLSRNALEVCKRAIRDADTLSFQGGLSRTERTYLEETARHPDAIEGIRAYLQKRRPSWSL